jgi:[protein-PII] uridylyltransferase
MSSLKLARETLVADRSLRGREFGAALSEAVDAALGADAVALELPGTWTLVALGSYARRELCPGSDVDVMLLHGGGRRGPSLPSERVGRLWYPLWDAGFVLGHSVRTVKQALDLADEDLDAMTSFLEMRRIVGDEALLADLTERVRRLAPRRRSRLVPQLAEAAAARVDQPGPIAEMLEPNLKDGAGALRDVQAPGWAGWALGPTGAVADGWLGGVGALVASGFVDPGEPERLAAARDQLLDARVALHRASGGRSDLLTLQDQDAVARLVGAADADALVRELGATGREVAWITSDLWARLLAAERGPRSRSTGTRDLGDGIVVRDGRIAYERDEPLDATTALRLAAAAARLRCQYERPTLNRIGTLTEVDWTDDARDAFVDLLATGRQAIGVFETLDHVGVLVRLLPEWEHVRARPQRNAYHRFTVDRHSWEAVAEAAALLDPDDPAGSGFDGDVARRARRDLLLLAALLHDVGKGRPGDHSAVGAQTARQVAERIRLDGPGTETLVWLVSQHLLLAETATRRDIGDEVTINRFAREVATPERLDLLYGLTIADSRATGPAAWSTSKGELVRELWMRTDALLHEGTLTRESVQHRRALRDLVGAAADDFLDAMPSSYAVAFPASELAHHLELVAAGTTTVEWSVGDDRSVRCTLAAPDRTGLLATVAGTLTLLGFDIASAAGYSHHDGMAIEVFTGTDRFERLRSPDDQARATGMLEQALAGELALEERLAERRRRYRRPLPTSDRDVQVRVDLEAAAFATVVEVHAPDDVGLLARVAAVFADLDLDVSQALVATLGDRVVDVFYVRDANGQKLTDALTLERLRATVLARLTTAVALD